MSVGNISWGGCGTLWGGGGSVVSVVFRFFFFNDTATTEIYTLSLHDALPICGVTSKCEKKLLSGLPIHFIATQLLGEVLRYF